MTPGDWILRRFEVIEPMGEQGLVELVRDRLRPEWLGVLKRARRAPEIKALEKECHHLLELSHRAVRGVRCAGRTSTGESLMVLEYVDGVDLADYLGAHPSDATRCAEELLRVLLFLHEGGRVHGDLKPANVLIDRSEQLRLIDLGLTSSIGALPIGGTRPYLAPEHERGEPLSVAGDLYALGQTLHDAAGKGRSRWPRSLETLVEACRAEDSAARPASASAALARLGVRPRPLDRLGRIPSQGLSGVVRTIWENVERFDGATIVVKGDRGSGRTRCAESLKHLALGSNRPVLDVSLSEGHDPLTVLRELLHSLAAPRGTLGEVVAEAMAAASGEELAVILDDSDQISMDLRHALIDGARALGALARGVLVVIGADEALTCALSTVGASIVELPRWTEKQIRRALENACVLAEPSIAAALHRGSQGRPGVVCNTIDHILAQPGLGPSEVEEFARKSSAHEELEIKVPSSIEVALEAAQEAIEGRAGRKAAHLIELALPEIHTSLREHKEAAVLLARAEALSGNLEAATTILDTLKDLLSTESLLDLARHQERLGHNEEARKEAAALFSKPGVAPRAAVIAATAALASGATSEATEAVRIGLLHAEAPEDRAQLCLIDSDLALRRGDAPRARSHVEEALGLLESSPGASDPRALASANSRMGSIYSLTGDARRARDSHAVALEAAKAAGDLAGLAPYVMNLATAEHALGELASAIAMYEEAGRLSARLGRTATRAAALTNLAGLLSSVGALGEAEKVLAEAQEAAEASGTSVYRAQATLIGAEIAGLRDLGRGRSLARAARQEFLALGAGRQALEAELLEAELFENHATGEASSAWHCDHVDQLDEAGLGIRARLLGARLGIETDDLDTARAYAEDAAELAANSGDKELEAHALGLLATVHARLGTGGESPFRARAREALASVAARLPPGLRERFLSDPSRAAIAGYGEASGAREKPSHGLSSDARRLLALVRRVLLEGEERRVLEAALDEAVELTRAERAFLLRLEQKGQRGRSKEVIVARNLDGESIRRRRSSFSRSVAEGVIKTGEPVVTAMATEDPRLQGARSILDLGLRSIICVPIRNPSGIVGVLYLDHRFQEGRFGEEELEVVGALADVIGIALENARLHRESREREVALERAHEAVSRENLLRAAELERMSEQLAKATTDTSVHEGGIVGQSPAIKRALELSRRVAPSDLPVLVEGESGTGKELIARYIHERSLRSRGPFLAVNCGAIPEPLLESELFGHVRGAFTGATHDHAGLLRASDSGTLLLDEIGEMPFGMQTRLLRALQEHKVRPVGSSESISLNVRVLAATNRDLEQEVGAGRFREDLYYRLVGVRVEVSPLRERLEDVPILSKFLLDRIAQEPGMRKVQLSRDALALLLEHRWPGNVRELEQTLRRAVLVAEGDEIRALDLGLTATRTSRQIALRRYDEELVRQALAAAGGNRTKAAQALGVSRVTVQRWVKRYGL